jgi:hypothetical protein
MSEAGLLIRRRVLFPMIEQALPAEELDLLGAAVARMENGHE